MIESDGVPLQELVQNIQPEFGLSRSLTDPGSEVQQDQIFNRLRSCIEAFAVRVSDLQLRNKELETQLLEHKLEFSARSSKQAQGCGQRTNSMTQGRSEIDLIDKKELALRLKKSLRWVEQQCNSGALPKIKIKRSVFFDWNAVCLSLKARSSGGFVRKY